MSPESDSVRIARIEEGLVRVHERIGSNHREVMTALKPTVDRVEKHDTSITILKRDRYWVFLLFGGALGLASIALEKVLGGP